MSDADDAIRRAFEQAAATDPPVDPSGVANAVRNAASTPAPPAPRSLFRGWMAGLGAVGLVAGITVGATGALDSDPTAVTMKLDAVRTYRCPGAGEAGALHRGDRVLAVARSKDNKWFAVREPMHLGSTVWVDARAVHGDSSSDGLPVGGCDPHGAVDVAGVPITSTTSAPTDTTTTVPGATTTTIAGATPTTVKGTPTTVKSGTTIAPTTAPATTPAPTTVPPDTTGPSINNVSSATNPIYENSGTCSSLVPKTTKISANATDPSGVSSVSMSWKLNGQPYKDQANLTSKVMTVISGKYQATLGPFGDVPDPNVTLLVTISATDGKGNTSTATISVIVNSCFFG